MKRTLALSTTLAAVLVITVACSAKTNKDEHADHDDHDDHGKQGEHGGETKSGHGEHKGEGHAGDEGVVKIGKAAIARNNIRVGKADAGRLGGGIEAPAEVTLLPDKIAHVTILVPGRLTSVKAKLGDKVKRGDLLASVESVDLSEAQSAVAQTQAALDIAKKNFDRQKELQTAGIGAKRNYDEAEAALRRAEADLAAAAHRTRVYGGSATGATVTVRAPIDGEVVERHATVGEVVDPEEAIFVVADLSKVAIDGRVYEKDVATAASGAPARLTLQAYPGKQWDGTLDYVSPRLDEKTRTVTVRMTLDNVDKSLKPGLFGLLTLLAKSDAPPLALVPVDALQRMKDGDALFVPGDAEGEFKLVPVAAGTKKNGQVEILSGLAPGDAIVVAGAFVLKSELLRGELGEGHAH
jgi:cobalt-zinc-cadmium efflux system membrane fusion protein